MPTAVATDSPKLTKERSKSSSSKDKSSSKKDKSSSKKEKKSKKRSKSDDTDSASSDDELVAKDSAKHKKIKTVKETSSVAIVGGMATPVESPTPASTSDTEEPSSVVVVAEDLAKPAIDPSLALSSFRLTQSTVKALTDRGVTALFPIQAATFDAIYDGKDLLGRARTGTGKTLAFALPMVERLKLQNQSLGMHQRREPRAIILAPTRELARQVAAEFEMAAAGQLNVLCVYGGVGYEEQNRPLRRGVDVVVGTPGRVQDHITRGNLRLGSVEFVCLDEADQMLDIGFKEAMEEVLRTVRSQKEARRKESGKEATEGKGFQALLFSATLPQWVYHVVREHLEHDHVTVDLIGQQKLKSAETVQHYVIQAQWAARSDIIGDVVSVYGSTATCRTIIFVNTKNDASELSLHPQLSRTAKALHGDIPQAQRESTLAMFRAGKCRVIVCTDVAARGLDIPEVDLVVNYEKTNNCETYIHRSGRTGRAGRSGVCVTFVKPAEIGWVRHLESKAGMRVQMVGAPGAQDVVAVAAKDASEKVTEVPDSAWKQFSTAAGQLIEQHGPERALAAALALVSGRATGVAARSLLTAQSGQVTLLFRTTRPINNPGYVRAMLARRFPGVENAIKLMRLTEDKCGVVADFTEDSIVFGSGKDDEDKPVVTLESICGVTWGDEQDISAEVCRELPKLQEREGESAGFGGGGRGGWGGRRGGGGFSGGRGGRFGGGGGRFAQRR